MGNIKFKALMEKFANHEWRKLWFFDEAKLILTQGPSTEELDLAKSPIEIGHWGIKFVMDLDSHCHIWWHMRSWSSMGRPNCTSLKKRRSIPFSRHLWSSHGKGTTWWVYFYTRQRYPHTTQTTRDFLDEMYRADGFLNLGASCSKGSLRWRASYCGGLEWGVEINMEIYTEGLCVYMEATLNICSEFCCKLCSHPFSMRVFRKSRVWLRCGWSVFRSPASARRTLFFGCR